MRWSKAAKTPSRNWRASVGWPTRSSANGLCESISALVSSRSSSSCSGAKWVGLADAEHDTATTLVLLGGQQGLRLRDQVRLLGAWLGTPCVDDGQVQTTCAKGWRGDVDDVVRGRVQLAGGGADGDGLADAHFAGDDAEQRLATAEADTPTASWWLPRSHNWAAGIVLLKGVRVKPKWVTQGARLIVGPPMLWTANLDTQCGRATAPRARRRPCPGNRRRSTVAVWVAALAAPGGAHGGR